MPPRPSWAAPPWGSVASLEILPPSLLRLWIFTNLSLPHSLVRGGFTDPHSLAPQYYLNPNRVSQDILNRPSPTCKSPVMTHESRLTTRGRELKPNFKTNTNNSEYVFSKGFHNHSRTLSSMTLNGTSLRWGAVPVRERH